MIKRKNRVKAIATMAIVMIMLIIITVPVFATKNEVSVLDDFVIQVKNPTENDYSVTLKIQYQDENGDNLYNKRVYKGVKAFETITINPKDYYNSEKTQNVTVEITREIDSTFEDFYCMIAVIVFIIGCALVIPLFCMLIWLLVCFILWLWNKILDWICSM